MGNHFVLAVSAIAPLAPLCSLSKLGKLQTLSFGGIQVFGFVVRTVLFSFSFLGT